MTTDLVSILIPCYNAQRWIGQAIESALAQSYPFKEVIVVDDGSSDASLDVIKGFGDRIRWETGPNRGGNIARNRLLEQSRGTWLQYLDADDYLLSDKIARQVAFIASQPDVDIVFSPVILEHWTPTSQRQEVLSIPEPHDPWILLSRWFLPQTGAPLWRKATIKGRGGWKEDQPCCQEHELYLRLLMAGARFAYCDHAGSVYRQWMEYTVSKRNRGEVRRRRLEILARQEAFLVEREEMTTARLWAINQARFETARTAWQHEPSEALAIVEGICRSQPRFRPAGKAAPLPYQLIFGLLGFRSAEKIADWRRRKLAPQSQ